MAVDYEKYVAILKAKGLWPPIKNAPDTSVNTVHENLPPGLVTYNGVNTVAIAVSDGDTFETWQAGYVHDGFGDHGSIPSDLPGNEDLVSVHRLYGVDTNETAKAGKGTPAENYANWQTLASNAIIEDAINNNIPIDINDNVVGYYGRAVTDWKIGNDHLSDILVATGITPPGNGADTKPVDAGSTTKNRLQAEYNRATNEHRGVHGMRGDDKFVHKPLAKLKKKINYLQDLVNDRYDSKKKLGDDIIKIGDVYLDIPPTNINIAQLRTSYATPMIGGASKPTTSSSARTVIKMNLIFSGERSINTDLLRIIQQFKYCPINLFYSKDIFQKVVGDNKYLAKSYNTTEGEWFIPVTMDNYTIYTIDGKPNVLGCTIQLSVFNYTSYFNGDVSEKVEYMKFTKAVEGEKNATAVGNMDYTFTPHLEEALHPYNIYIKRHLDNKVRRFISDDSYTLLYKIVGDERSKEFTNGDVDTAGIGEATVEMNNGLEQQFDVIFNSEVEGLTTGTSIHFENNFAWMPVIGYSAPAAQYIGPGETLVSVNIKTNSNEIVSKLMSTFSDVSTVDLTGSGWYDDRYVISNSVVSLCESEVCSIKNFSANNMAPPQNDNDIGGWTDINLVFNKSSWAFDHDETNPVAEFDEYYGLQRILKAAGGELDTALEKEFRSNKFTNLHIDSNHRVFAEIAKKSGYSPIRRYVDERAEAAYTKSLLKTILHKESFMSNGRLALLLGINPDLDALAEDQDDNVHDSQNRYSLIGMTRAAQVPDIPAEELTFDGAKIYDTMTISSMPKIKANRGYKDTASSLYKAFSDDVNATYGKIHASTLSGQSFAAAILMDNRAGYRLRKELINAAGGDGRLPKVLNPKGISITLSEMNFALVNEYEQAHQSTEGYKGDYLEAGSHGVQDSSKYQDYKKMVASQITTGLGKARLGSIVENWNDKSIAERLGYSVGISFVGTNVDARIIYLSFLLGTRDKYQGHAKMIAHKFFGVTEGASEGDFPAFTVEVTGSEEAYNHKFDITHSNMKDEKRWDFIVTYIPSETNSDISEFYSKDKIDLLEVANDVSSADAMSKGVDKGFVAPYAAHRYYPYVEQFIKHEEVFSTSVGEWFANRLMEDPYAIFEQVAETVESSLSPLKNTAAFDNKIMEQKKGKEFIKKVTEDPNDFTKVAEALCYPGARRDLSDTEQDNATNKRVGVDGKIDTTMPRMSQEMDPDPETGQPRKEYDFPISTPHEMAVFSTGNYEYAKIQGEQIAAFKTNVANNLFMGGDSARRTAYIYNYQNRLQGKLSGGVLEQAGSISDQSVGPVVEGVERKLVDSDIDVRIQMGGAYPANCLLMSLQKDPHTFMREVNRVPPALDALGADGGFNEVEATYKLINMFYKILDARSKDTSLSALGNYRPATVLMQEATIHVRILKDKLSPSTNAYYVDQELAAWYLDNMAEINTDIWGNWPPLPDGFAVAVGVNVADHLPTEQESVDKHTKELVSRNALASMMPTSGLENAFPTYKMYIIEEDQSDIRYFSLDDWYDLRTAQDLMIVKDKNNPAHTLKARVVVDHKQLITSDRVRQRIHDRNDPQEFESGIPSPQLADTRDENYFNKGFVPFREGMRICIKLGYHTDPRALDTVFIGTITGLSGNMSTGVYDLEAKGDGRELLTPPHQDLRPNVTGKNFAEIISIMLRTNPAVTHFGKVYGSFLEKFSRRHFALLALAKHTKVLDGAKLAGAIGGVGLSLSMFPMGRAIVRKAAVKLAVGSAVGAGLYLFHAYTDETVRMYNKTSLFGSDRNSHEELSVYSNRIFDWNDGAWSIFSREFGEKNFAQVGDWMKGNTFDPKKASRQMAGILWNTYKQGNNPVDDNIWAVDIWQAGITPWKTFDMPINSTRTVWDVMVDIKRMYPNFALDVRPYGARSTLFMGPKGFNIWRTDDPLQAMAPQLDQISNQYMLDGKYHEKTKEIMLGQVTKDRFGDARPDTNNVAPWVPFQKHHNVASFSDIIMNGIRSTAYRGWNQVVVTYSKGGSANSENPTIVQSANANLDPRSIRTKYAQLDWTDDPGLANAYALGLLKEGVERMYGGTLIIKGNSKIEPYDKVFVCDAVNKMFGWIEVETVIHKFDHQMGYTTHIVPNMVCSINNDTYSTHGQVMRRQMQGNWAKVLGPIIGGTAGGYALAAGLGKAGVSMAATGPIGFVFAAALVVGVIGYAAWSSYTRITEMAERYSSAEDEAQARRADKEYLNDRLNWMMIANSAHAGFTSGMITKFLVNVAGGERRVAKGIYNAFRHPLGSATKGTKLLSESAKARHSAGAAYIKEWSSARKITKVVGMMDEAAAKAGLTMEWDKYRNMSPGKARKAMLKQMATITEKLGEGFNPKTQEMLAKNLGSKNAVKEIIESTAKKSTKEGIVKTGFKVATPALKFGASGLLTVAMVGLESLPMIFESYVINSMMKSNAIICSPLFSKYAMLMTGMEGYQNRESFLHIKDMILQAESYIDTAKDALSEWDLNIQIGGDTSPIATSIKRSIFSTGGQWDESAVVAPSGDNK